MAARPSADPAIGAFVEQARADPGGTLLALDIDGTVSAIAPAPDEAVVAPGLQATLDRLAERYRLWFLSGRDADQAGRMVGVAGAGYVGAHGLEALDADGLRPLAPVPDLAAGLTRLAEAVVAEVPEVAPHVERKRWSVAFHYRAFPAPSGVAARLRRAIEARLMPSLRLRAGKMVYEVEPAVDHNKGTALLWLIERLRPRRVLVAGDDLTDVAMFAAISGRPGLPAVRVAVVQEGETPRELLDAADAQLDGVTGLHALLRALLPDG